MELIDIRTFDNLIDAHLLKSKLESEGVRCIIQDENVVGLNPIISVGLGGIKVRINAKDRERALEVLKEMDHAELTDDQGKPIVCPKCSSKDLISDFRSMKNWKGLFAVLISLAFAIFPIYFDTVYKCRSCDHEFKQAKS